MSTFKGIAYRLADNWFGSINLNEFNNRPIKYLEIGTFYGANLFSVAKTYAAHKDSELHAIDPWTDYRGYTEYKNEQQTIYSTFLENLANFSGRDKITIHRDFSHKALHRFEDEYFDIIYIDGNHEPEYVLEDAVLSFRKLKKNGIMIFDDYGWGGPDLTKRGIDAFLSGYHKRIQYIREDSTQVFIRKLH